MNTHEDFVMYIAPYKVYKNILQSCFLEKHSLTRRQDLHLKQFK